MSKEIIQFDQAMFESKLDAMVLVLIDDCIRWHNHERIRRSLGWMSPVQYRQSQGMAA